MANASEIEDRVKELTTEFKTREAANNTLVGTAPVQMVNGVQTTVIDEARRTEFSKNLAVMREIKASLSLLKEQKDLSEWGNAPASGSVALAAAAGAAGNRGGYKSLGQQFVESKDFEEMRSSGGATMRAPWKALGVKDLGGMFSATRGVENKGLQTKDVYTSEPTGGPPLGFAPLWRDPIVVQAFRKVRVRDLFPVQPTDAAVIEFFRVTGFVTDNAASTVPEWDTTQSPANFGLAPHTSLNFEGVQAPVRTIAHWEAAHRHVLEDVPQLQGIIDTELLYGLRLAEDNQLLNGTGTGSDLLGILNTPDVQTYLALNAGTSGKRSGSGAGLATDTKADDVRRAATQVILSYYEPTGVVMHPSDWEAIETLKDSTGAYIVAIAIAVGGEQRIWRLPVVDTPAIAQGTALVGSFGLGATLYDREESSIRIAEQHADFFLRDAIVVLAEERVTVATKRPESFVTVTFGA
jgi:HK97 family phage major capsid protein